MILSIRSSLLALVLLLSAVRADDDGRSHWAFRPPVPPPLPPVKKAAWVRNGVDRFVLARLEKEGLEPSAEADRTTLIRRLYLDLLGLPPGIESVDAFCSDQRPDAYQRLVDQLLASPHYGERWGRHWLDAARYADTQGFTIDGPREIWKYRDWVIDALNRDLPFDRFVVEQMAGDLLPGASLEQKIATGFHRNTLINEEGGIDLEQFRVEAVADRVNTTGTVFLGLTLGCARCHDHKYDPISQREYFQLFAFLNNQAEPTLSLAPPEIAQKRDSIRTQVAKMEQELDGLLRKYVQQITETEKQKWKREITVILNLNLSQRTEAQKQTLAVFFSPRSPEFKSRFDRIADLLRTEPKFPTTLVLAELPHPRHTVIHLGGDFTRKGPAVEAGVPAVLHPLPKAWSQNREAWGVGRGAFSGSDRSTLHAPRSTLGASRTTPHVPANRLDLANWLVHRSNPLLGRVMVNRLWQHYFGKGLVETENDFGTQGTPPSHPELLDWLATEFAERGWSLKAVHRLIVTSATYRQSSRARPELAGLDPNNKFLARQNRLRLDAEIVRDSALAVSGLLCEKLGGPSVHPPQPKGVYEFTQVQRAWNTDAGMDRYRRGVYTYFQRSAPYPSLTVFDAPDGTSTCTRRIRSNTPLQALTLLNDQAFLELAQGLACRICNSSSDGEERVRWAFRLCMSRAPSLAEARRLHQYLRLQTEEYQANPDDARALVGHGSTATKEEHRVLPTAHASRQAAWVALARVLLNLDEFITRE